MMEMGAAPALRPFGGRRRRVMVGCRASALTPEDIRRACEGDRSILARLFDVLDPVITVEVEVAVRRRAIAVRRDPKQNTRDLVQDVWLHLLERRGRLLQKWDPERGRSLSSFVRLLTRNRLARVFSGFRGNPWATDPTEDEQLESYRNDGGVAQRHTVSRIYLEQVLDKVRARLNERGLRLFDLIYVQLLPIPEICEVMGMTRAAVDQWKSRFKRRVASLVEEAPS